MYAPNNTGGTNTIWVTPQQPQYLYKKDIIRRLFEQQHISFDEMWLLLQEDDSKYIILSDFNASPYTYTVPGYPTTTFTVTADGSNTGGVHLTTTGGADIKAYPSNSCDSGNGKE